MVPIPRRSPLLILLGLFFLALVLVVSWFLFIPPSNTATDKVVYIKKGTPLRRVAATLQQEGIIRNRHLFVGLATVLQKKRELKAGEYELHTGMLPLEVLDTLVKGQVKHHLVTIPEGYTAHQIAELLEELNIVEKQPFLEKITSPLLIQSLGLSQAAGSTLEGYLFPETYHLIRGMEPEEVIRMMVHQFQKNFDLEMGKRASEIGLSEGEAVILASIIEKETSLPEEKPLISAVFHNRLRIKMPLQSDPTVIYGIKNFDGNLTREHLTLPTPYNTYLKIGLPPTPVCNPGKESLWAALHPAPVPYLYFVSKNDGSHYFSFDIEDHNRAVSKYQKKNSLTKK